MTIVTHNTHREIVAKDVEWDKTLISVYGLANDTICAQFYIPNALPGLERWICFNVELKTQNIVPVAIQKRIEAHCKLRDINLLWVSFDDSNDVLNGVLDSLEHSFIDEDGQVFEISYKEIDSLMFSSPRDIWKSHGWDNVRPYFDDATIDKKRSISGLYELSGRKFKEWDLSGWTNEGLKSLASSVGVDTKDKGLMDEYKSCMLKGLLEKPELFIDYSMNDPEMLPEIVEKFTQAQRDLQIETLGLPEHVAYTIDTIPRTVGAVVAGSIQKVVDWKIYESDPELFQYCLRIMGVLDASHKLHKKALEHYNFCVEHIKNRTDFDKYRNSKQVKYLLTNAKFEFFAYSYCSVKWCGSDTRTSNAFNALVHGGRAHNEQPNTYKHGYSFDADERSAYGTQLAKQVLPIGLPRYICQTPNQAGITVSQFLDKHIPKCDDYQWQAVFSGKMPVISNKQQKQDLITSKRTTQKAINDAIILDSNKEDTKNSDIPDELRKIPGDFGVFKLEVENGILTQRVLEAYIKSASEHEIKALRNMSVVAGVMYYTEDKVTVDEWIDIVLADTGSYTTNDRGNPVENRTRAWFPFDLGEIFRKTIQARNYWKPRAKKLKKQLGKMSKNDEKYVQIQNEFKLAAGKQEALKLFNNTGYGVLISAYFPISNVIVGNNITSGIRVDTWMLKVAIAGYGTITDGCGYDPRKVLFLIAGKGKWKPSLTTIADIETLRSHRAIKTGNLAGIDWDSEFEKAWSQRELTDIMWMDATTEEYRVLEATELDRLATIHVNNFWSVYGLELASTIEHKNENVAYAAATWGKADYGFLLIKPMKNPKTGEESEYLIKARGCKQYATDSELRMSPKFELFRNILHEIDDFPDDMGYDQFSLCSPGKYRQVNNSNGYLDLKDIRPGDDIVQGRVAKFNNDWCVEDFAQYDTRKRRTVRKNAVCFEKFKHEGIAKVHKRMMEDRLR
jgi:hypothetical protein